MIDLTETVDWLRRVFGGMFGSSVNGNLQAIIVRFGDRVGLNEPNCLLPAFFAMFIARAQAMNGQGSAPQNSKMAEHSFVDKSGIIPPILNFAVPDPGSRAKCFVRRVTHGIEAWLTFA